MKTLILALALQAGLAGGAAAPMAPRAPMLCSEVPPRYREGGVNDTTHRGPGTRPARRAASPPSRAIQSGAVDQRRPAGRPITSPRDATSGLPTAR